MVAFRISIYVKSDKLNELLSNYGLYVHLKVH